MEPSTLLSHFGNWSLGNFTLIDLIAAATNAFNGALLAHRPDHDKHFTVVGIMLLAIVGGVGGGITRDVLLNAIPAALTSPWYLIFSLLAALSALLVARRTGPELRSRLLGLMTAFALPWYAVVGTQKALGNHLPFIAAVAIGVIGATTGRYIIDLTSLVPPQHFVRGEWFVGTAILASILYISLHEIWLSLWPATLITVVLACAFRLTAQALKWEEPETWEPTLPKRIT